jgi:hypothetical protein
MKGIGYEYGVFMRMHVSIPKLPNCICCAMHVKKWQEFLIHKVVSKTRRISSGLRIRLDLWLARNFWMSLRFIIELDLITTSTNSTLQRSLWKEMFNQGITSMRGFRNYQTTFGITTQISCTRKLLVQPTAITNQPRLLYTRVPFNYYTLTTHNCISHIPTS